MKKLTYISIALFGVILSANLSIIYLIHNVNTRIIFIEVSSILISLLATTALYLAANRSKIICKRLFWAWGFLALAQLSFTLGDFIWGVLEVRMGPQPFPSIADGFYLLFYLLFFIGILFLPSQHIERLKSYKILLDASIVLVVASIGFWIFLLGPVIASNANQPLLNQALALAYPAGDLVLFVAVQKLLYLSSKDESHAPLFFLIAGAAVMITVDSIYSYQTILGKYSSGRLLDLGWITSYYLIGMAGVWQAALAPHEAKTDMQAASSSITQPENNSWLIYLSYTWIPVAFIILILNYTGQIHLDLFATVGAIIAISLVLIRQILTFHENEFLFGQLHEALNQVTERTVELQRANQELRWEVHERARIEKQIAYDSLHDGLTGLPNRTLFMDRLYHAIEFMKRHEDFCFVTIFLDIDQFKEINDSLGHPIGDQVLIEMAQRLSACLRTSDTVARLGGDEFIILLEDTQELEGVPQVIDRIQNRLKEPLTLEGRMLSITASFGIVANGNSYSQAEDIIRDADIAMYQAKMDGKARYAIFDPQMRDQAAWRLKMKADLQKAITYGEFFLNYQPIFSLSGNRILGFEALLRWQHPQNGVISPLDFIPLAEETGLILPIGTWVLHQACRQLLEWQARFPQTPPLTMSVNVSSIQIKQADFVDQVQEALQKTGVDGNSLILEITEGVLLNRSESITNRFKALNAMGIQFQIDDFGTGYSSLSYVKDFPINSIKIDRSFIQKIGVDNSADIVRTIINLAHSLRQGAIAEGIETEGQLEDLKKANCDAGQGYLLSRPKGIEDVEKLLIKQQDHEITRPINGRQAIVWEKMEV
jgi:diguanylate cyclase (GGDEF)-like protein